MRLSHLGLIGIPGWDNHCPELVGCPESGSCPSGKHLPLLGEQRDAEVSDRCPKSTGQASRACLVDDGSVQVVSKGIMGLYNALFKKKGQAIELRRLIRLN